MILPVSVMSEDWMQVLFGLGIGNVSPSSISGMEGAYVDLGQQLGYGMTAIGDLLWETGIVGTVVYLFMFIQIWRSTRRCGRLDENSDSSWYSTWWSTCLLIFIFGLVYKSVLQLNELGYMVFFWSGVLVSRYWRLQYSTDGMLGRNAQMTHRIQLAGRNV
jgi:hypothetical protein